MVTPCVYHQFLSRLEEVLHGAQEKAGFDKELNVQSLEYSIILLYLYPMKSTLRCHPSRGEESL
jgi:hypothetical protein